MLLADNLTVSMKKLSYFSQNIEANQSIVVEEDFNPLERDRLRVAFDDYDSILFKPERKILLKDDKYVFLMPPPK